MSIQIIPIDQQGHGAFNGGEIVENKPIGFPQDRSSIRPYSNLFYWAHAKSLTDSTIGLHPHQGFEICSFVLKGNIRHFDTKLNDWKPLEAGDVQIIRAGNGISHSEWMGKDAEMFQIWFDPNLQKTLEQPASYDDYKLVDFPTSTPDDDLSVTTLVGHGSPFRMDTPGIQVLRIQIGATRYPLSLSEGFMASTYVIEGEALVNGENIKQSDFVLAQGESELIFESLAGADIFVIISPVQPGYLTYGQIMKSRAHA